MAGERIHSLELGLGPKVIGTIITAEFLRAWMNDRPALPCDLVELRVDGFSDFAGWLEAGRALENSGIPVIITIRSSAEGGLWKGDEGQRREMLNAALNSLSGIDVELHSAIAQPLAARAKELQRTCILSFHDFQKTAPREELMVLLKRMESFGSVAKIAATANSPEDVVTLRSLLREKWQVPVCIIGMGTHGRETRLAFPLEGSCLSYGYLDKPGAPGQYSARELKEYFENTAVRS